jgi:acetyl-CoA carboxylase alpha subunit
VADVVLMLENSIYSVISPEGCAAILWTDRSKAPKAAEAMKMTAQNLLDLGVIDGIIPEPPGGAHRDPREAALRVREAIVSNLARLDRIPVDELVDRRIEKYWNMGVYEEKGRPEETHRDSLSDEDARGDVEIG